MTMTVMTWYKTAGGIFLSDASHMSMCLIFSKDLSWLTKVNKNSLQYKFWGDMLVTTWRVHTASQLGWELGGSLGGASCPDPRPTKAPEPLLLTTGEGEGGDHLGRFWATSYLPSSPYGFFSGELQLDFCFFFFKCKTGGLSFSC